YTQSSGVPQFRVMDAGLRSLPPGTPPAPNNQRFISGSVFNDVNMNGTKDSFEFGIGGTRVFVDLNGDGLFGRDEPTAITSSTGAYRIDNALAGKCWLRMEHLKGYAATTPAAYHIV